MFVAVPHAIMHAPPLSRRTALTSRAPARAPSIPTLLPLPDRLANPSHARRPPASHCKSSCHASVLRIAWRASIDLSVQRLASLAGPEARPVVCVCDAPLIPSALPRSLPRPRARLKHPLRLP
eukprot:3371106-Rhodomonas_salina.1